MEIVAVLLEAGWHELALFAAIGAVGWFMSRLKHTIEGLHDCIEGLKEQFAGFRKEYKADQKELHGRDTRNSDRISKLEGQRGDDVR